MQDVAAGAQPPIPLVVIGGYLGAGKTTLLNAMLANAGQRKIAVLVNDFGDINIDAALIRERTDDVINLENGCICCSIGGRLVDALLKIGMRPERPELLIIEASGVSDPVKIAQIGLLDRAFRLYGIVVAVDAERVRATLFDPYVGDIVQRQIASATALVLTKVDLVSDADKTAATGTIAALNASAVVFESGHGQREPLPLELILETPAAPRSRSDPALTSTRTTANRHHDICSFSWRSDFPLDKKKLKAMFRDLDVPMLRSKGIVWLNREAAPQELHVVGGRTLITPFIGTASAESTVVLIGRFTAEHEQALKLRLDDTRVLNTP